VNDKPVTIEQLERWETYGAHWQAAQITNESATVDLCACTGELVETRHTINPHLIEYLRNRRTDQS
jgi:hypothetical protein